MSSVRNNLQQVVKHLRTPESWWHIGMLSAVMLIVLTGMMVSVRLHNFGQDSARLSHSYSVLGDITELLHQLGTSEVNEREFLVTRDPNLIRSRSEQEKKWLPLVERLRAKTLDNPLQTKKIGVVSALISAKLEQREAFDRVLKNVGRNSAYKMLRLNLEKKIYDNLNVTLHEMQQQEETLLTARLIEFEKTRKGSKSVIQLVVGIATGLILLLLYIEWMLSRNRRSLIHSSRLIKQKEDEFKTIANAMPQIVWVTNAKGTIEYLNDRWYEYTNASRTEPLDTLTQYLHPADRDKTIAIREDSLKTGETYEAKYRLLNKRDGSYRWFIARALPLFKDDGSILRWFGTTTDIHDQAIRSEERERLLQGERSARDEAEHANNVKNQYIATLSHELRGALNAILGWTQILLSKPTDPQLVRRGVGVIDKNARIQSQLVSDLFDINRINAGKFTVKFERVDLSELVSMIADTILPACADRNLRLVTHIEPEVKDIPSEGSRISQILMNVLNNSIKFTPSGGIITLSLFTDADSAIIEVHDTGAGIDPAMIDHIFEQYNQGTCSLADKQSGMGLGLTLARRIVTMLGGTIEAKSEGLGRGSLFQIKLPLRPLEGMLVPPAKLVPERSRIPDQSVDGISVLVVEDQDDAREAIARILTERGAIVTTASNGAEGLRKLKEKTPQVVVSDISMPEMDGFAFARELKRQYPALPAIALTALMRDEDKQRALASGFRMQLAKPTNIQSLLIAIKTLSKDGLSETLH